MLDHNGLTQCRAPNTRGLAPGTTSRTMSLSERPTYQMFGLTYTLKTNNSYGTLPYPRMYSRQITEPNRSTGLVNDTGLVTSNKFPPIYYYNKFSLQAHTWNTEKVCL